MRALMRPDPAGAVVIHADTREEPRSLSRLPVGTDVVLHERPQRRLLVADDHALLAPSLEQALRVGVGVDADRQVDPHDVVGRAGLEITALVLVDHVVGRGHDVLEPASPVQVVVKRPQRFDIGHAGV